MQAGVSGGRLGWGVRGEDSSGAFCPCQWTLDRQKQPKPFSAAGAGGFARASVK